MAVQQELAAGCDGHWFLRAWLVGLLRRLGCEQAWLGSCSSLPLLLQLPLLTHVPIQGPSLAYIITGLTQQSLTTSNSQQQPADPPGHHAKLQQVLEAVLHQHARHDAHGGGQGRGAHTLPLEGALVDACSSTPGGREHAQGWLKVLARQSLTMKSQLLVCWLRLCHPWWYKKENWDEFNNHLVPFIQGCVCGASAAAAHLRPPLGGARTGSRRSRQG